MNRVIQINIVQTENGFTVQGGQKQFVATDESGVQESIQKLLPDLLKAPEPSAVKSQTIKRFDAQGKEV